KKVETPVKSKALSAVKDGRVTKKSQTPKSKSKETAKDVASKASKDKKSKKSKKEPTPEPESDSDEEMDSDSSASESESDSESSAGASESSDESDSDSESEDEKPAAKKAKATPAAKAKSDSESDSDDESSDEEAKPAAKKAKAESSDSSDSDESEDEKPAAKKAASSDDSDSDSDASSEEAAPSKKRKAEDEEKPAAKKSKTDVPANASANLFVGNLSWNVDEDWLAREFEEFGEISGCRIVTDRATGRSKGFGYVEYTNIEDAVKALKARKDYELDGRALNVDYSTPRPANDASGNGRDRANARANKFGDAPKDPSDTLFVGNLSFDASADDVQNLFAEYGSITRVSLPTDPDSGALKGFGYVGFSSIDEAKGAYEACFGAEIAGRAIRLDYATPRDNNGGGGGRGGFGGRGRGGPRGGGSFGGRGGGRGGPRGGFGARGGGRGGSFNRGGFSDFKGKKTTFD
ncbi:hypothetical protein IWX90DRAFT_373891, partial [Phyllosticta citrichinensis]